jgi:hypothetical protein
MWTLEWTDEFRRRYSRYEKNNPRELRAVLDNLDTYVLSIQAGAHPLVRAFGFVHTEPMGVIAIDQKGGGKALAQTRLYVYPDAKAKVLYAVTLGDKRSQSADIQFCREFVASVREQEGGSHEQEERNP